ncbi:MAG: radical SAM protein, partial [Chloroflexota bacterium]
MATYEELARSGELRRRVEQAWALLENCHVCPRHCDVNRLQGGMGKCRTAARAVVSSFSPHFGEERPLVGRHGSGTIFFTHCNLRCVFCQNYSISQLGEGEEVSMEELARMMLSLQAMGCHNINLVSPTHVVPQILKALEVASARGLRVPLVYNSGGYDAVETLRVLDGVVDIYMPDMKYADEAIAEELSGVKDYPRTNQAAVKEMHRQVGDLQVGEDGVATRGLLVRHLVLPHDLAGTARVVRHLAQQISANTYVNIMAQYRPCHQAYRYPKLSRPLTREEYLRALLEAKRAG